MKRSGEDDGGSALQNLMCTDFAGLKFPQTARTQLITELTAGWNEEALQVGDVEEPSSVSSAKINGLQVGKCSIESGKRLMYSRNRIGPR